MRLALAEEEAGSVEREAILILASDSDAVVALTAQAHLDRLDGLTRRRTRTGQAALTGAGLVSFLAFKALGGKRSSAQAAAYSDDDA